MSGHHYRARGEGPLSCDVPCLCPSHSTHHHLWHRPNKWGDFPWDSSQSFQQYSSRSADWGWEHWHRVANSETWKRNWVSVADCQTLASPTLINGCRFICAGGGEEKTAKNSCAPGPAGSALQRPSCFPVATPSTTVSKSGVPFPSTWSIKKEANVGVRVSSLGGKTHAYQHGIARLLERRMQLEDVGPKTDQ